jgi:hypothetical protein
MTKDNIETRRLYRDAYLGSMGIALMDLEILDMATSIMNFDDMTEARNLMDEKIPNWK